MRTSLACSGVVRFRGTGDLYGTMIAELIPLVTESADILRERIGARLANEDVTWD